MSGKFDGILLATDVDGTLANFNEIPRRNIEAIQHFVKEGGMFTVCTGRGYAMTYDIVNQVPVNVPGICVNGMQLYDFQQKKVISEIYQMCIRDREKTFMVKSMTGFGRSEAQDENRKFLVEMKAVNHQIGRAHV